MAHFAVGDILVGASSGPDTLVLLHRDQSGVAIDEHPIDAASADDSPDEIHFFNNAIYLVLGTQVRIWDLDGNDVGSFYGPEPLDDFGDPPIMGTMVFRSDGSAWLLRDKYTDENGDQHDLIRVASGILAEEFINVISNNSINCGLFLLPDATCVVDYTNGSVLIHAYDTCIPDDAPDFFFDADHFGDIYGQVAIPEGMYVGAVVGSSGYAYLLDNSGVKQGELGPWDSWFPRKMDMSLDNSRIWAVSQSTPNQDKLGWIDVTTGALTLIDLPYDASSVAVVRLGAVTRRRRRPFGIVIG